MVVKLHVCVWVFVCVWEGVGLFMCVWRCVEVWVYSCVYVRGCGFIHVCVCVVCVVCTIHSTLHVHDWLHYSRCVIAHNYATGYTMMWVERVVTRLDCEAVIWMHQSDSCGLKQLVILTYRAMY